MTYNMPIPVVPGHSGGREIMHHGSSQTDKPYRHGNLRITPKDPWAALRMISPDDGDLCFDSSLPLVESYRSHPAARAFDLLRTRLVRALTQHGWSRIAITAPTKGCGSTFTAVNLALSLQRVRGSRTVLMDMDQRSPGVAAALGVEGSYPISEYLSGTVSMHRHMLRMSDTLALGLNTKANLNASEQLHDSMTGLTLDEMQESLEPEVVLYDLPAMLEHDDLTAFLPEVDGVLIVADGTKTTRHQIAECERALNGQAQLLGVVLNRGRESKT